MFTKDEIVLTTFENLSTQILFFLETWLIIRISMSCPHFNSCQSNQEHSAHGAFLVAFQLSFNINIVPPSVPSTRQTHRMSNLSFK